MTMLRRSELVCHPHALPLLARGMEMLAAPLALTLGPGKGCVLHALNHHQFEMLADSATIARRVIRLAERESNLGAMMMREMALELQARTGDGVATAAVMVRALVHAARRLLAAGFSSPLLVRGLRAGVDAAVAALNAQARPVAGLDELTALAWSVTGDPKLSRLLGEMFETLGEHATIIIQEMPTAGLDYEYIRGGKWDGYIPARQILPEGEAALVLHDPLIVLTHEALTTIEQVQPMLELALAWPGKPPLCVLARGISGDALNMLTTNHVRGVLTIGLFVLSSGILSLQDDLEDLAAVTGGQVYAPLTGLLLRDMQPEGFGQARRVILSTNAVTLAGGSGEPRVVQQRITGVKAALKHTAGERESEDAWNLLRVRLARLSGGIGVLKLGAGSEQEMESQKAQITKTRRILELAYAEGVVPGGGSAFLACLPALQKLRPQLATLDEQAGLTLVEAALTAPFLQIVRNHGEVHPPLALETVQRLGCGYGFDAQRGDYACMAERHILDALSVARGSLQAAASVATMMMSTDTLVFNA